MRVDDVGAVGGICEGIYSKDAQVLQVLVSLHTHKKSKNLFRIYSIRVHESNDSSTGLIVIDESIGGCVLHTGE